MFSLTLFAGGALSAPCSFMSGLWFQAFLRLQIGLTHLANLKVHIPRVLRLDSVPNWSHWNSTPPRPGGEQTPQCCFKCSNQDSGATDEKEVSRSDGGRDAVSLGLCTSCNVLEELTCKNPLNLKECPQSKSGFLKICTSSSSSFKILLLSVW